MGATAVGRARPSRPAARASAARLARVAGVGALASAVAAVLLGLFFSGAAAPELLRDPGALVRWGLPVVDVAAQLAVATTVGGLVLAACVLPRTAVARRGATPAQARLAADGAAAWPAAMRVAALAAGVWTVLAVLAVVLGYARAVGAPVGGQGFGPGLQQFVSDIGLGRSLLGVAVVAALTTVVATAVTTPLGAVAGLGLVGIALAIQSTQGHAAGTSSHELAISAMAMHLVGAAVWVGTLLAIGLLAPRLGSAAGPAVARFSPIAGWCLALVGLSGVVSAWIRLPDPSDLASRYGALVLVKVALLAGLGALGLAHRRYVLPRLAATPDPRPLLWRLVGVELLLMGAVSGVAFALAATGPPEGEAESGGLTPAQIVTGHPLPPEPTAGTWVSFTGWGWDVILATAAVAGAIVYLRWAWRLRRRGDSWPIGRTIAWLLGMALFLYVTSGPLAVYGHVLFSVHMVEHMLLAMVVPIALVLAAPVTLALRALPARPDGSRGPREWLLALVGSRWARLLSTPVVAAVLFAGSMLVFYYSPLFRLALSTYAGHLGMVLHFTLAGYLFANALVGIDPGPRRPGYPLRLLLLLATMGFHAFFGVALMTGSELLVADWFGLLGRPWGPSALADQQAGGGVAWSVGEIPTFILALVVAFLWAHDDERAARRGDRAEERSGGAELAEYNAMLARLAARDQGPTGPTRGGATGRSRGSASGPDDRGTDVGAP